MDIHSITNDVTTLWSDSTSLSSFLGNTQKCYRVKEYKKHNSLKIAHIASTVFLFPLKLKSLCYPQTLIAQPQMVLFTCGPSDWETEARWFEVSGWPGPHSKTVTKKKPHCAEKSQTFLVSVTCNALLFQADLILYKVLVGYHFFKITIPCRSFIYRGVCHSQADRTNSTPVSSKQHFSFCRTCLLYCIFPLKFLRIFISWCMMKEVWLLFSS